MTPEQISSSYDSWIIARRWAAFWLDCVFLVAAGIVLSLPDKFRGVLIGAWLLLVVLYYPLLEGFTGSSFGKWMCRLKVVNAQGETPGLIKACIRTFLRLIEVNPLLFGGIPAGIVVASSSTRQRLGDQAAHTYVLRCEDLPLIGVPLQAPVQRVPEFLPIPSIPELNPSPFGHGSLAQNAYARSPLTSYPGNIGSNPLSQSVIWAAPGAILLSVLTVVFTIAAFCIHGVLSKNTHPITMSCADFIKHPKANGWYHLTGCKWDVAGSVWPIYEKKDKDELGYEATPTGIQEVYVPVFPLDGAAPKLTGLVVLSTNQGVRNTVTGLNALNPDDEKAAEKWGAEHKSELDLHGDIEGTIQSDYEVSKAIRDKLLAPPDIEVSSNFVVIKEGDGPAEVGTIAAGVGAFISGIGAFLFLILVCVNLSQRANARVRG